MTAEELRDRLSEEATAAGYFLNPDAEFVLELARGLLANTGRYGYPACPCRLATGDRAADLDIICPCDYRDADLEEYGACFCALYVDEAAASGSAETRSIPDRRPVRKTPSPSGDIVDKSSEGYPVWRCRVCGYLCARDAPPGKCPICKADRDRFERFPSAVIG